MRQQDSDFQIVPISLFFKINFHFCSVSAGVPDLNQPNIEALDDESTEQLSPLIISSLHPVRSHVVPIELPQRWIPPAF